MENNFIKIHKWLYRFRGFTEPAYGYVTDYLIGEYTKKRALIFR